MKPQTLAELHQHAAEVALEHFRESFILAFTTMSEGLPKQYRKSAREIIAFFSEETTPEVWAQLTMIPDPENPMQSLAESWLQQWESLNVAVGNKEEAA